MQKKIRSGMEITRIISISLGLYGGESVYLCDKLDFYKLFLLKSEDISENCLFNDL